MDVSPVLVADLQAPEAVEPGERPFDHPSVASQMVLGLDTTACDVGDDAALAQGQTEATVVVPVVGMELVRSDTRGRPPWGFGGSGGSSGAFRAHNASGNSSFRHGSLLHGSSYALLAACATVLSGVLGPKPYQRAEAFIRRAIWFTLTSRISPITDLKMPIAAANANCGICEARPTRYT